MNRIFLVLACSACGGWSQQVQALPENQELLSLGDADARATQSARGEGGGMTKPLKPLAMFLMAFNTMGATRGATWQFRGTRAQPQMVGGRDDNDNGDSYGDKWRSHYEELARLARQVKVQYHPGMPETQLAGKPDAWVLMPENYEGTETVRVYTVNPGPGRLPGRMAQGAFRRPGFTRNGPGSGPYPELPMFEDFDDASRFAAQLEAEDVSGLKPVRWSSNDLISFCHANKYYAFLVPQGALMLPPGGSRPSTMQPEYNEDEVQRRAQPHSDSDGLDFRWALAGPQQFRGTFPATEQRTSRTSDKWTAADDAALAKYRYQAQHNSGSNQNPSTAKRYVQQQQELFRNNKAKYTTGDQVQEPEVLDLGLPQIVLQNLPSAWIVLFDEGSAAEGAFTLESPANYLTYLPVFERKEDVDRYIEELTEKMPLTDGARCTAVEWPIDQITGLCRHQKLFVDLVHQGEQRTVPTATRFITQLFRKQSPEQWQWTFQDDAALQKYMRDQRFREGF